MGITILRLVSQCLFSVIFSIRNYEYWVDHQLPKIVNWSFFCLRGKTEFGWDLYLSDTFLSKMFKPCEFSHRNYRFTNITSSPIIISTVAISATQVIFLHIIHLSFRIFEWSMCYMTCYMTGLICIGEFNCFDCHPSEG